MLVHFLPRWSAFSAPYPDQDVDALSWVLAVLPVAAGLYLSAVALRCMSKNRRIRPQASSAEASS